MRGVKRTWSEGSGSGEEGDESEPHAKRARVGAGAGAGAGAGEFQRTTPGEIPDPGPSAPPATFFDLREIRAHVREVERRAKSGGKSEEPASAPRAGIRSSESGGGSALTAAVAARRPRPVAKASRKNNGGWRVGRGHHTVGGRSVATGILTTFMGNISGAAARSTAIIATRDEGAASAAAALSAASATHERDDECNHRKHLRESNGGATGGGGTTVMERCPYTIFTDTDGGSYVCTRTGLMMGEGLIMLAEREHRGDIDAYGSDGDEDKEGADYGTDPIARGGAAAIEAGGTRKDSQGAEKVALRNEARSERTLSSTVMTVLGGRRNEPKQTKPQAIRSKNETIVRNLVALLLCQTPIIGQFYTRRNTSYFTDAGKAASALVRTTTEPSRGSRAKARCPFPHEAADAYSKEVSRCCVMPDARHKGETVECVTRILICAHVAIASTPAGNDILPSTPIPLYVGFMCAMQGEGNIYTADYLEGEDMPDLAHAIRAQSTRARFDGRARAGPFNDPFDTLVCVPTGRFINDLPVPADLSGISKLLSQRRGVRSQGHLAYPETSHVTSGACRLRECFLSMMRLADIMERTEPGTGLAYVHAKIYEYRMLIRDAAPIFVSY
jgi:hypothetical protein